MPATCPDERRLRTGAGKPVGMSVASGLHPPAYGVEPAGGMVTVEKVVGASTAISAVVDDGSVRVVVDSTKLDEDSTKLDEDSCGACVSLRVGTSGVSVVTGGTGTGTIGVSVFGGSWTAVDVGGGGGGGGGGGDGSNVTTLVATMVLVTSGLTVVMMVKRGPLTTTAFPFPFPFPLIKSEREDPPSPSSLPSSGSESFFRKKSRNRASLTLGRGAKRRCFFRELSMPPSPDVELQLTMDQSYPRWCWSRHREAVVVLGSTVTAGRHGGRGVFLLPQELPNTDT